MASDCGFLLGDFRLMRQPTPAKTAMGEAGERLAEWREYRGLTQARLAELVNEIDPKAKLVGNDVSRFERGARGLSVRWQRNFSRALQIPQWQLQRSPFDPSLDPMMEGATHEQWEMARRFIRDVLGLRQDC